MAKRQTERKRKEDIGAGILTVQDCINMYINGQGYVAINAGKVIAVHTRKGDRRGKQQSAISSKGIHEA